MEYEVTEEHAGVRLDLFLCAVVPELGRAGAKKLTADRCVRVNGRLARKGDRVDAGDTVAVEGSPTPRDFPATADPTLALRIAFEHPDFVVADKDAGVPCHPIAPDEIGTLASALLCRYPEMSSVGHAAKEPGIIHRLDNDTSGLILAARTEQGFTALRELLTAGSIDKRYDALCAGTVRAPQRIDLPVAHDPGNRRAMVACMDERDVDRLRARNAITEVLTSTPRDDKTSLVHVRARSARRHQVRVHLATMGHPLIGDDLYGGPGEGRHRLHASRLVFEYAGETIDVSSPPPADFK